MAVKRVLERDFPAALACCLVGVYNGDVIDQAALTFIP